MLDSSLYQVIIDSMSAHVAILDEYGVIVETNRSWQDFARHNGMAEPYDSIGINYLENVNALLVTTERRAALWQKAYAKCWEVIFPSF